MPANLSSNIPAMTSAGGDAVSRLIADRDTLREIVAGLDRLEALVDETPVFAAAARREYFTPDEDDRVRQALLAYRNYRLATYEIIPAIVTMRALRMRVCGQAVFWSCSPLRSSSMRNR
jgi:hypothetical protein